MQEDTLQVLRDYLQNRHMKEKHKDFSNEWNYVQGPTTRYDKYYRLWCMCICIQAPLGVRAYP